MIKLLCKYIACFLFFSASALWAQPGTVLKFQKISQTQGGFSVLLDDEDNFGQNIAALGDLNGDGIQDIAVGAGKDDDGGLNHGAVYILFLNPDGTVKGHQKISDTAGGFTAPLSSNDWLGGGMAGLGDLDGDDVPDLAVGAAGDNNGGNSAGAVYILFLNTDGTVKSYQKISSSFGNFGGSLVADDQFGAKVANLGDLDGDDVVDLAVGAIRDSENGFSRGAIWILFLNADGTVKSQQKINESNGGFTGTLDNEDFFATVSTLGDLDGDDVTDIAVGAERDDDGGTDRGAVWILFLNEDGTVKAHQKISSTDGGFTGVLDDGDLFGGTEGLGDIDNDGIPDLAVGARLDDDGGWARGAVWILFLNSDGTVKSHQKISMTSGNFNHDLGYLGTFGGGIALLPDLDGDYRSELVVGAHRDDDGGVGGNADRGAVYILNIDGVQDFTKLEESISQKMVQMEVKRDEALGRLNELLPLVSDVQNDLVFLMNQTSDPGRRDDLSEALCRVHLIYEITWKSRAWYTQSIQFLDEAQSVVEGQAQVMCNPVLLLRTSADLNTDGLVNYDDMALMTQVWMEQTLDPNSLQ